MKNNKMISSLLPVDLVNSIEMIELKNYIYPDDPSSPNKSRADQLWALCICAIMALWSLSARCNNPDNTSGKIVDSKGRPMSIDQIAAYIIPYLFGRSNNGVRDHKKTLEVLDCLIEVGILVIDEASGAYACPLRAGSQSDRYVRKHKDQMTMQEKANVRKQQQRLRDGGKPEMSKDESIVYVFVRRAADAGYNTKQDKLICEAWATQWVTDHPGEIPDVAEFDAYIRNSVNTAPACEAEPYEATMDEPAPDEYDCCSDQCEAQTEADEPVSVPAAGDQYEDYLNDLDESGEEIIVPTREGGEDEPDLGGADHRDTRDEEEQPADQD